METLTRPTLPSRHALQLGALLPAARPAKRAAVDAAKGRLSDLLMESRHVWLPPLACELCLFSGAANLSWFFFSVLAGEPHALPLDFVAISLVGFLGLALWAHWRELFMPRVVIFLGVFPPALLTGALLVMAFLCPRWTGISLGLGKRAIVALPFALFLARSYITIRGARFAPGLSSLSRRAATRPPGLDQLKKRLSFWLS